jgi:tetratricopeptide (TPR) repeat protein
LATFRGSTVDAAKLLKESLPLFKELADSWYLAVASVRLGDLAVQTCRYDEAERPIQVGLALFRELGDVFFAAGALQSLGALERERTQYDRAREHCEEALDMVRPTQYAYSIANALEALAHLALAQGDYREAVARAEEALNPLKGMELGRAARGSVLCILGIALAELGDRVRALTTLRESLASSQEKGANPEIVSCLEGLAGIFSCTGQKEQAVRLFGAAAQMREDMGIPVPASGRRRYDSYMAVTRAELEEAWQLGFAVPRRPTGVRDAPGIWVVNIRHPHPIQIPLDGDFT